MNTQLSFIQEISVHTVERTPEGTAHVRANAKKFGGNCMKIIRHFQNGGAPISDDTARMWLGVRNLPQRCADLRNSGIVVLATWNESRTHKLYKLGCQCAEPGRDKTGCYLHL